MGEGLRANVAGATGGGREAPDDAALGQLDRGDHEGPHVRTPDPDPVVRRGRQPQGLTLELGAAEDGHFTNLSS
jgi:hypothetical protein